MSMQRYILCRLRAETRVFFVRGRRIAHHSAFGNLHALPLADALRLHELGTVKLPKHLSLNVLREDVARLAAAA